MTHRPDSDSTLVADSLRQFAERHGGLARARDAKDNPRFHEDAAQRARFAEPGWFGIAVAEARGGAGMGWQQTCALAAMAGHYLLPDPLIGAVASAQALSACGGENADRALTALLRGDRNVVLFPEPLAPQESSTINDIPDCPPGSELMVLVEDQDGARLVMLCEQQAGIQATRQSCVDGGSLTRLVLSPSVWRDAPRLAEDDEARAVFADGRDLQWLARAAYLNGLAGAALDITLDYLRLRNQFGRALGTFQALQHRMATCHVDLIAARALLTEACLARGTEGQAAAARAAVARAGAGALRITAEAIQCHGAIGFSDEHDIGLFRRKAMAMAAPGGGETGHLLEYARLAER
ncbi:acyl-CoA dehydrogenase [Alloalcanivorax gelatiniphagus]|uniref:Acyl-CoA dehydrogenase n=2 Tax=Alloalcanivorax gelatiniphagus TaxID=1194167 RepID=A0ABY2XM41_9GAMM|nr:acyl-CoA dehydrogenase [Alloalcanivorax gelatiniphagus]TMW13353.1 hypothetical protein FGS76_07230 [Alloalcanivorax gelatiniphagus]